MRSEEEIRILLKDIQVIYKKHPKNNTALTCIDMLKWILQEQQQEAYPFDK
jgi:hypothetical protein